MNGGVVGDGGGVQVRGVIAFVVLNGVAVVGAGWICVGNGDGLIVFDSVGESENDGGTGDGNASDGIGSAIGFDREGGSRCGGGRERLVVGEDDFFAVG